MTKTYVITIDDKDGDYDLEAILDIGLDECRLSSDEFEVLSIVEQ